MGFFFSGQLRVDDDKEDEEEPFSYRAFPPMPSGILQGRTAIAPWSKYQQKLKTEQQLAMRHYLKPTIQKSAVVKRPISENEQTEQNEQTDTNIVSDNSIPVIITLPPYSSLEKQKSDWKNGRNEILFGSQREGKQKLLKKPYIFSAKNTEIPSTVAEKKATYSTASNHYQIPAINQRRKMLVLFIFVYFCSFFLSLSFFFST